MTEAVIPGYVRTAGGCRIGALAGWRPADMGGNALGETDAELTATPVHELRTPGEAGGIASVIIVEAL